jgi:hypothetical protein
MKTLPLFILLMCLAAVLVFLGLHYSPAMRAMDLPAFIWLLPFALAYDVLSKIIGVKFLPPLNYNERAAGFVIAAVFLLMLNKIY